MPRLGTLVADWTQRDNVPTVTEPQYNPGQGMWTSNSGVTGSPRYRYVRGRIVRVRQLEFRKWVGYRLLHWPIPKSHRTTHNENDLGRLLKDFIISSLRRKVPTLYKFHPKLYIYEPVSTPLQHHRKDMILSHGATLVRNTCRRPIMTKWFEL